MEGEGDGERTDVIQRSADVHIEILGAANLFLQVLLDRTDALVEDKLLEIVPARQGDVQN